MIAAEIIGQVRAAGGRITADGADLVLTAPRPLPAELLDSIKTHKPALLAELAHSSLTAAALAELPPEDPTCPAWRISIVGPRALNIELETRSAWTVSDWGRFARRHYGPDATVVARAEPEAAPLWWRVSINAPGGRRVEVDSPSGFTMAEWQAYAARYHGSGCTVTPIAQLPMPRAPVPLGEALATACEGLAGITPMQFRALLSPEDVQDIEAGGIHPRTLKAYAASFAEGIASGRIAVP